VSEHLAGARLERTWLDERSWVDVARGWLAQPAEVFDAVLDGVTWQQGRVFRYERWVDEPRLGGSLRPGTGPHAALVDTQRALQHHYGVQLGGMGLAHYRDGRDLMAFHRDRDMRWLDETLIALLVLGAHRPFHLRPRSNRYDHDASHKGATHDFSPGEGDLLVMGGACQVGWEHSVPPAPGVTRPRISVQWRWTSGRGRPAVGASYSAPRTYSRR
jgi:alkylated DNA repair dioxygenase AlkB